MYQNTTLSSKTQVNLPATACKPPAKNPPVTAPAAAAIPGATTMGSEVDEDKWFWHGNDDDDDGILFVVLFLIWLFKTTVFVKASADPAHEAAKRSAQIESRDADVVIVILSED